MQRLLNRAVRTSLSDLDFMAEANRLAVEQPQALLMRCAANASMDEAQADLMCALLAAIPALASLCATAEAEQLLCGWLNALLADPLQSSRQRAVLLMLARLTQPSKHQSSSGSEDKTGGGVPEGENVTGTGPPLLARNALLSHVLLPLLRKNSPADGFHSLSVALQVFPKLTEEEP